jgi:hypothetical protein
MGTTLLLTLFSHRVQPLHQGGMTMWMYSGPSCPDHPFSQSWVIRISTPGSEGFLLMGPI